MSKHRLRLQGGPFDGTRHELGRRKGAAVDPPARVWIVRCGVCGSHIFRDRTPGSELYRRDAQDVKGLWVYVFTDQSGRTQHSVSELEKAAA